MTSQTVPGPKTRNLAQRLLAYEAGGNSCEANTPAAFRVSEKLRRPLSILAGATGFRSLLGRALALTKTQSHSFGAVHVKPDGSLEGLNELHPDEAAEAGAMIIANLLGLLVAFIGEPLTVHLVQDVWPDLSVDGISSGKRNQHDPTR
jgi:hypothetical protein